MKTHIILRLIFFLVVIASLTVIGKAQVMVTKVVPESPAPVGGDLFYTLPKTVLKVNLVFEKIARQKGPLSAYAAEYMGVSDIILSAESTFRLLDAGIEPLPVTDPNGMYYVQFPADKAKDELNPVFYLAENGALLSINDNENLPMAKPFPELQQTILFKKESESFDYEASYNKRKKMDTVVRKISIDTMTINRFLFKTNWVDKSVKERAEEAAQQIAKIREARYNLLTGYHEVNFGESLQYMDNQLKKMEQDYLELFLGKETSTIIAQTVFYSPQKGEKQVPIWKSSEGETVLLELNVDAILKGLTEAPISGSNIVYYRIPAQTFVKVSYKGDIFFNQLIPINQLGIVSTAHISKARLHFDPRSGSLISMVKE